ncbi:MAG: hypothetical protein V8R51_06645 [Clostridia bacterium]
MGINELPTVGTEIKYTGNNQPEMEVAEQGTTYNLENETTEKLPETAQQENKVDLLEEIAKVSQEPIDLKSRNFKGIRNTK